VIQTATESLSLRLRKGTNWKKKINGLQKEEGGGGYSKRREEEEEESCRDAGVEEHQIMPVCIKDREERAERIRNSPTTGKSEEGKRKLAVFLKKEIKKGRFRNANLGPKRKGTAKSPN